MKRSAVVRRLFLACGLLAFVPSGSARAQSFGHPLGMSLFAQIDNCSDGSGLAWQPSRNRFIVACSNKLWTVSADLTNPVVAPFAQGNGEGLPFTFGPEEPQIAVSAGLGGFVADEVFVATGT